MTNRKQGLTIVYLILLVGSIIMVFPFLWSVLTSFKTQAESLAVPLKWMPESWDFFNYKKINETLPFVNLFLNTTLMVIFRCIFSVFLAALAGYAFARLKFPLRNFFFMMVLIPMMVPGQVFILSQYLIVSKLGLLNTVTALVIPGIVSTFGTFLLRQFFLGIPNDLEEAAILDGCSIWQIFSKIMLPLTKSGLVSVGIFTALFAWKDLMWPLIVNMSVDKLTLSAGLATLIGQYSINYPELMAGSLIAIVPMIVLFLFLQKQFIEGIVTSGIKG
ncbi:carbohydrate ABC transporter permease [Paenibacillus sp.]|uniref:carbohydrate ABC transporter permease n=1 Tax=Paenibacillus sp. TaxID=58172 RepID=UPI0028A682EF|nr:carbohydrate ABC transporter permease [Paenibacillus sp.]